MHIGVIGAGRHGATLAEWCAQSGHDVAVTSRHPERLGPVVDRLGGHGKSLTVAEAAAWADVVLLTTSWETTHEAIDLTEGHLAGKVVIDATNPIGGLPAGEHSGLEALIHAEPDAHWVKALNTLPTRVLDRRRGHDPLLAEFVCTDLRDARLAASDLIRQMGFAPVYAGGAEAARLTETGGPLQLNEIDVFHATDALAEALATIQHS